MALRIARGLFRLWLVVVLVGFSFLLLRDGGKPST